VEKVSHFHSKPWAALTPQEMRNTRVYFSEELREI